MSNTTTTKAREQSLREALHAGNLRHLARRSGATWLPGLDGFAISEQDLAKLLEQRDSLLEACKAGIAELNRCIDSDETVIRRVRAAIAQEGRAK